MKIDIWDTDKRYGVVVCDPPWKIVKGGKKAVRPNSSGLPLDYDTMSYEDIHKVLERAYELLEDSGVIFLWAIESNLDRVESMAKEVGFKLHVRMIYSKYPYGVPAAFTIRYGHEYMLYMYKGKLLPVAKEERGKIHSVFTEAPMRGMHSKKPEVSYEIIDRLYPEQNKLEMFARIHREGYDVWGNEAPEEVDIWW